jgi:lipopolysaccharide/colanic/teichoic acid biosynthesis glycosyltransferase
MTNSLLRLTQGVDWVAEATELQRRLAVFEPTGLGINVTDIASYEVTMTDRQRIIKRIFDICVSATALAIGWPLIALGWVMCRWSTGMGGFFVQDRVGRSGCVFRLVKLRTMREVPAVTTTVTTSRDPRITRTGRVLRALKVDELPQLWNVLAGDMSLVGPRPDVPSYADRLQGEDRLILSVRPGITGPATLKYRNEEQILATQDEPQRYNDTVIFPDKVRINKDYVVNYSLVTDFIYLFRTFVRR